jgi:hypothetical protein
LAAALKIHASGFTNACDWICGATSRKRSAARTLFPLPGERVRVRADHNTKWFNTRPHPGLLPTRLRQTTARFILHSRVGAKRRRKEKENHSPRASVLNPRFNRG